MILIGIKLLNKIKIEFGSKYPELYFGIVAMKENIEGIPDLARLAAELNIKGLIVHRLGIKDAELAIPQQGLENDKPFALNYFGKAEKIAKENGILFRYPLFSIKKLNRLSLCQLPWINCQIDLWGNVYPCCRLRKSFGNIFKQDIYEIWNGGNYRRLRKLTAAKKMLCPQCEESILSFK